MKLPLLIVLLLTGCAMTRPEGSYVRPERDDPAKDSDFSASDGGVRDARVIPRPDTDDPDDPGDDGEPGEPSDHPLAPLTGRYLMRMDMHSEASLGSLLTLKNRMSNLVLVDLYLEGDTLLGRETLCDQTYVHSCVKGCETWTTKIHPDALERLRSLPMVTREYTYDPETGELAGQELSIALGFDENGDEALPSQVDDRRVWRLPQGRGVYTQIDVTGTLAGRLTCAVSTVQRFRTNLRGTLPEARPSLERTEFELDTTRAAGAALKVEGNNPICMGGDVLTGGPAEPSANDGVQRVRFKKYAGDACPADFDALLPGDPP